MSCTELLFATTAIAAFKRATISDGVPAGTAIPDSDPPSASLPSTSLTVGISGRLARRRAEVTANGLIWPDSMKPTAVTADTAVTSVFPLITAVRDSLPLLYGT
ncbi:hypothetical protein D3C85_1302060 [compost metagenome]